MSIFDFSLMLPTQVYCEQSLDMLTTEEEAPTKLLRDLAEMLHVSLVNWSKCMFQLTQVTLLSIG